MSTSSSVILLLLVCTYFSQIDFLEGKGTFSIKILQLVNDANKAFDGQCCSSPTTSSNCHGPCAKVTYKICLAHLGPELSLTESDSEYECHYGRTSIDEATTSNIKFRDSNAPHASIEFTDAAWPRSFALIVEAFNTVHGNTFLIDRVVHRGVLMPVSPNDRSASSNDQSNGGSVTATTPRSVILQMVIKMECAENYYSANCTKMCVPVPGRYTCDKSGDKDCEAGWMGRNCSKAICKTGCHPVHGYCTQPGRCMCVDGWTGAYCNECKKYPGCQHGTCGNSPWTCECYHNWGGQFCDQDLDHCGRHQPCKNGGVCTNVHGDSSNKRYQCTCLKGFAGVNCSEKLDPCDLNPCKRGACHSDKLGYTCTCNEGWEGFNCDKNIDYCTPDLCRNGGTCIDGDEPNDYECRCPVGYSGTNCHDRSPCSQSPCEHASACTTRYNGEYTCTCQPGWTGKHCNQNIDDCTGKCLNGGKCNDLIDDFFCECPEGYKGRNCEVSQPCLSNPCHNRGICLNLDNGGYQCKCPEGFTGDRCQIVHSGCNPNPCLNGAYCYTLINDFFCKCTPNFWGKNCEHPRPYCQAGLDESGRSCRTASDPCSQEASGGYGICGEFGSCVSTSNSDIKCDCQPGYEGKYCQINANDCVRQADNQLPCLNGGTCLDGVNDFECLCIEGFHGKRCEIQQDLCMLKPCRNDGICKSLVNDFICECKDTYGGRWCEIDVYNDDAVCTKNTCFNHGECSFNFSSPNRFTCNCFHGWQGTVCHIRKLEHRHCHPNPCQNDGTCVTSGKGYNCVCKLGYEGVNCEHRANKCNPMPCYNGGKCTTLVNSYRCDCITGFVGPNCQTNENDCADNPCAYGSTCIDEINTFRCECPEGRKGRLCDEMVESSKGKPPSCIFERRVYDNGQSWLYNCQQCVCTMGVTTCVDAFCGEWSCEKATSANDKYACKPPEKCYILTNSAAVCFVPPCYPRARCLSSSSNLLNTDGTLIEAPVWPPEAARNCQPDSRAILGNQCARILLTFDRTYLPYSVYVHDVCLAMKQINDLETYKGQGIGLSCGLSVDDENVIEVYISTDRIFPKNTKRRLNDFEARTDPLVFDVVQSIEKGLKVVVTNTTYLKGIKLVRIETMLADENQLNAKYTIAITCSVAVFLGIIAIAGLLVYHFRQERHLREKYAPYHAANNTRDPGVYPAPRSGTGGRGGKLRTPFFKSEKEDVVSSKPLRSTDIAEMGVDPRFMGYPSSGVGGRRNMGQPPDFYGGGNMGGVTTHSQAAKTKNVNLGGRNISSGLPPNSVIREMSGTGVDV